MKRLVIVALILLVAASVGQSQQLCDSNWLKPRLQALVDSIEEGGQGNSDESLATEAAVYLKGVMDTWTGQKPQTPDQLFPWLAEVSKKVLDQLDEYKSTKKCVYIVLKAMDDVQGK
jgi:hypothetical protein